MIPDVSDAISWLEANPYALKGIGRGIEREGLRINASGTLAQTPHPEVLGAALTHKWITTDFAEALLEFVTPVDENVDHMLILLRDIHRHVALNLGGERLWPMSMPCFIDSTQAIKLAQYGTSNIGLMKTLYREGLKNRYTTLVQIISGVHYNFSLPLTFWQARTGVTDMVSGKDIISDGYLRLMRNYYRYGWIIPYLFGASPGICASFLHNRKTKLPFKVARSGLVYLPYATSLRLSDLGYTNKSHSQLDITFNNLEDYIYKLKQAIKTPATDYLKIGLQKDGRYLQLNTNILQIENELYAPIRPKRITQSNESPCDALMRGGIEYIEVRSLDINPFSPIGFTEEQVQFLDLFLVWCILAEASEMSTDELYYTRDNWNRVIIEGRKPGLMLGIACGKDELPLTILGKALFKDLQRLAKTFDKNNGNNQYQQVCTKLVAGFDYPELTLSALLLEKMKEHGISKLGLILANKYHKILSKEPLEVLTEAYFTAEQQRSWQKQREIEAGSTSSFEDFLASHNNS